MDGKARALWIWDGIILNETGRLYRMIGRSGLFIASSRDDALARARSRLQEIACQEGPGWKVEAVAAGAVNVEDLKRSLEELGERFRSEEGEDRAVDSEEYAQQLVGLAKMLDFAEENLKTARRYLGLPGKGQPTISHDPVMVRLSAETAAYWLNRIAQVQGAVAEDRRRALAEEGEGDGR